MNLAENIAQANIPKEVTFDVQLTEEQKVIIDTAPGVQVLLIEAGAGCGKTSTLVQLAKTMPGKGQYTAFNTSLVAESKTKFPTEVSCNTIHSLAFRSEGTKHAHRLGGRRIMATEIAAMLGVQPMTVTGPDDKDKVLSAGLLASILTNGIRKFCQSADKELLVTHLPRLAGIDKEHSKENSDFVRAYLLPFAYKMWEDKCNPEGKMPFAHDDYVKMWELGDPFIAANYILLDEAQDTSPVMLSIMEQQVKKGTKLILVGDSAQQIYSWRGAVNALAAFPDAPRLMLSQSFRFGQVVAEVANSILLNLQEKTPLVMRGFEKIKSRLDKLDNPTAILCRTNAGAISHLLDGLVKGKKPHLIGGGDEAVRFVRAARDLQSFKPTNHPELCSFTNWKEVVEYSSTEEGEDLKLMVKIIKEFGAEKLLRALESMPDEKDSDLLISTAHKSKGREWSGVKLAGDFMPLSKMGDEEIRLLYVAATRAQNILDVETCQPFCGGSSCEEEQPKPIDIIEARRLSKELFNTAEQLVDEAGKETIKQKQIFDGNIWTKDKTGTKWIVKGKPGQTGEIEVKRKNGTSTKVTIIKVIWQNTEVALYQV